MDQTDLTKRLLAEFVESNKGFQVIYNSIKEKLEPVITGMLAARGEIILFSDLDQATPLNQIEKLLPAFPDGFCVVIGSRSRERKGAPLLRKIMARGFMFLRSTILGLMDYRHAMWI